MLRPFLNPIVEKELRSRMRTGRASLLISFYLLTLAGVGWFTYVIVRRQASGAPQRLPPVRGRLGGDRLPRVPPQAECSAPGRPVPTIFQMIRRVRSPS